MSKGIFIGLGSVLFLGIIGSLALFNTWQVANLEERLISVDQSVLGLKSEIGSLNNRVRRMGKGGGGGMVASSNTGGPTPAGPSCDGNLITKENALVPEDAEFGGKLTRAIPAGSKGFNMITENGADVQEVFTYTNGAVAERYLQDPDLWASNLAWCVQRSEDYLVYTIKLRNDVYWHPIQPKYLEESPWLEGEHQTTAHDFKFAMDMILDVAVEGAAPLRTYYQDLDRIEVVNDFEFKVHWKKKTFQSMTFTLGLFPMPKWIYAHEPSGAEYPPERLGQNFNNHWYRDMMGNGPYRFDSFVEGDYVKLVKNSDYFGELPAFDEIIFRVIASQEQQLAQLKAGDLDFMLMQPSTFKKQVLEAGTSSQFTQDVDENGPAGGKFGVAVFPRMVYRYIGWDGDGVFFKDARVRTAMTHSLNRTLLLEEVFMGLGQITTGGFYPASSEYDKTIKPFEYDLEGAKKLLDEAGWKDTNGNGVRDKDGVEFEFTLLFYNYRPEFKFLAEFWKEDLKKIGVTMKISGVDWPTMQTKMNNKEFDAYTGGWGLSWESDPYQIWHSSQADLPEGSNRVGFRNKRADEIIELARVTFNPQKRLELFHEFHKIQHEEQPYTFLFAEKGVGAWSPSMRNVQFQKIRPHDVALPWFKDIP